MFHKCFQNPSHKCMLYHAIYLFFLGKNSSSLPPEVLLRFTKHIMYCSISDLLDMLSMVRGKGSSLPPEGLFTVYQTYYIWFYFRSTRYVIYDEREGQQFATCGSFTVYLKHYLWFYLRSTMYIIYGSISDLLDMLSMVRGKGSSLPPH